MMRLTVILGYLLLILTAAGFTSVGAYPLSQHDHPEPVSGEHPRQAGPICSLRWPLGSSFQVVLLWGLSQGSQGVG